MSSVMRFDQWQNTLGVPYNSIIQIQQGRNNVQQTTTSTSWVVGNQVTITPKFANSKILVWAYSPVRVYLNGVNPWMGVSLWRNSTRILHDARNAADTYSAGLGTHISGTSGNYWGGHSNQMVIDSPNTTNAVTYYAKFAAQTSSTQASYPHTESNDSSDAGAVIIVMEIAQ